MAIGISQIGVTPWGAFDLCGEVTDHKSRVLDLLPCQFDNSTNLRALLGAVVGPPGCGTWGLQEVECVAEDVLEDRWIDTAYGEQLDFLGDILGESRAYANDDDYRAFLRMKILINISKGVPDTLIAVALIASDAEYCHLTEKPVAALVIYCLAVSRVILLTRIQQAAPAGVHVSITATHTEDPFVFGFDRDASGNPHGSELPYGHGFGETNWPLEGGDFCDVFVE